MCAMVGTHCNCNLHSLIKHLFRSLFTIYISSLVRFLFRSFARFFIWLLVSLLLSFENYLYILNTCASPCVWLSHTCRVLCSSFHFLKGEFSRQKFLILMKSILSVFFSFYESRFQCHIEEIFAYPQVTESFCSILIRVL